MAIPQAWSSEQQFSHALGNVKRHDRPEKIGAAIRDIDFSQALLNIAPSGQCGSFWRKAVREAPDRLILARTARVKFYYYVVGAIKPSDILNNCDDMQYAVLASYTGHLATNDNGVKGCMAALFPKVRICDPQTDRLTMPKAGQDKVTSHNARTLRLSDE